VTLKNGKKRLLWTTFTDQQIDINVYHPQGQAYLQSVLQTLHENNIRMVRLDAVGYASKNRKRLLHDPETFAFISLAGELPLDIEVLAEIRPPSRQIELPARWIASMISRCPP
jgi:sucrose phosphorylase